MRSPMKFNNIIRRTVTTYAAPYRPLFVGLDPPGKTGSTNAVKILSVGKMLHDSTATIRNWNVLVNDGLTLQYGKRVARFDSIWLRDACRCEKCVDPHSGQKNFQTAHIPSRISIKEVSILEGDSIRIKWIEDLTGFDPDHHTVFSARTLLHDPEYGGDRRLHLHKLWHKNSMSELTNRLPYEGYMHDDEVYSVALKQLWHYGLILLDGVPDSEKSVEQMAERIGPLRNTFYGRTWDVKDTPKAENVAYTSKHLGMHMDLLYMKDPPGIQLLHCLKSSCEGGRSMFHDSFRSAHQLRAISPKAFDDLVRIPVKYKYDVGGHIYSDSKTTIELDPPGISAHIREVQSPQIANVNWSPPFQGIFEIDHGLQARGQDMLDYLTAAKAFASLVDDRRSTLYHRLEPGQCVIFNNRRILHAREAFYSGTGERWLKGAYVNTEDFKSAFHTQMRKFPYRRFDMPKGEQDLGQMSLREQDENHDVGVEDSTTQTADRPISFLGKQEL